MIKICGLSTPETIEAAFEAGATHVGLVHFEPSPRHVEIEHAARLRQLIPDTVKVVLLMANADVTTTGKAIGEIKPDIVQFHGRETPEWIKLVREKTGVETWKALGLKDAGTLKRCEKYIGAVDRFLF
ncbi:MAG: phosphoribosylanthranilate isomerase, partial [Pseudomonadota bacterium]